MNVHFYLSEPDLRAVPSLAANLDLHCWCPDLDGFPQRRARSAQNIVWWAFSRLGLFARPGFTAIWIERSGLILHRLIVTPRWYRFPFMDQHDLQIGNAWTAPEARRQQLATSAVREAYRRLGSDGTRFWWITDAGNTASGAWARESGYRLVATGRRTRPLGLPLLGQFVIDRWIQRGATATQAIDPDCGAASVAGRTVNVSH